MKKDRKPSRRRPSKPNHTYPNHSDAHPDQMRDYMARLAADHEEAWTAELYSQRPEWIYLLGLHLRLVALEHLEPAVEELL